MYKSRSDDSFRAMFKNNNNNDDDDDGGGGGGCRRNDGDRCGYTRRSRLLSKEKESVRRGEGIGR